MSTSIVTALLTRLRQGDAAAREQLFAHVYGELRALASRRLRGERADHTLQPTALVNEAYLRLQGVLGAAADRHHFFALASQAMRRILVDYARTRRAAKRGGEAVRVTLTGLHSVPDVNVDVLALDRALDELASLDPRAARVVELRYFGGHTDAEVCEILGENLTRVRRDWLFARGWLKQRLEGAAS